jgi:PilZ domain
MTREPNRNDGAAYLIALKEPATVGADPVAGTPQGDSRAEPAARMGQSYGGAEKRRSPRYKCEGSAEIREEGRDERTWATFTDISVHGCYVEATSTYPVGTILKIKLNARGCQVLAAGNVRVSYPGLGMGIAFTKMEEADRSSLRDLLGVVAGKTMDQGASSPPSPASASAVTMALALPDPSAAIRILVEYFQSRQVLGRDEFVRLVRKSQLAATPGS